MNQYYQILSSCRVPGPKQDSVINFKTKTSSAHITVVHNYQFFELDVYHSDGTPLTSDQIFVQLEKIWNSSLQTNKEPVGILTSNHRNSWAKAYNTLIKGAPGVRGHIPTSVHTRPWTGFSFSLNPRDSEQVSLAPFHR